MRERHVSALLCTIALCCLYISSGTVCAQNSALVTDLRTFTPLWQGERFPDGRPKVPDDVIERMKQVTTDDAWDILHEQGYDFQFEGGWVITGDQEVLVGRALTAVFMPVRPDVDEAAITEFEKDGTPFTGQSKEVVNRVSANDVVVVDLFGKIYKGTFIGNNLALNIGALGGNGIVVDGSSRDLEIVKNIPGFVTYTRGWDPTHLRETMLMGINTPVRIGDATAMPGDVVLADNEGIMFIPAHLAEHVVNTSEMLRLRDEFRAICYENRTYPIEQLYGTDWTGEIERGFQEFVREQDRKGLLTPYQREMLLE